MKLILLALAMASVPVFAQELPKHSYVNVPPEPATYAVQQERLKRVDEQLLNLQYQLNYIRSSVKTTHPGLWGSK